MAFFTGVIGENVLFQLLPSPGQDPRGLPWIERDDMRQICRHLGTETGRLVPHWHIFFCEPLSLCTSSISRYSSLGRSKRRNSSYQLPVRNHPLRALYVSRGGCTQPQGIAAIKNQSLEISQKDKTIPPSIGIRLHPMHAAVFEPRHASSPRNRRL